MATNNYDLDQGVWTLVAEASEESIALQLGSPVRVEVVALAAPGTPSGAGAVILDPYEIYTRAELGVGYIYARLADTVDSITIVVLAN